MKKKLIRYRILEKEYFGEYKVIANDTNIKSEGDKAFSAYR